MSPAFVLTKPSLYMQLENQRKMPVRFPRNVRHDNAVQGLALVPYQFVVKSDLSHHSLLVTGSKGGWELSSKFQREIADVTPEELLKLGAYESACAHSFAQLCGCLSELGHWLGTQQRSPWGFGRKDEVEVEPSRPVVETLKYDLGDRKNIWQVANHLGYRHILDTSTTGTGKSFDAGQLTPEMFDARQVIYISKDHRNPTVPTLDNWHDLEARHQGLHRDCFGKLRRVESEQPDVVAPNCGRNGTIAALRAKNIAAADTAELICATCPQLEPCLKGEVFGFLHDRAEALKQPQLRAHPDSLPDPQEYDYNHAVLIWEEASEILKAHRSIKVRAADVESIIANLALKLPATFDALRQLLTTLHLYISGGVKQPNKYGWGDAQVRQVLPEVGEIDTEAIALALYPQLGRILNPCDASSIDAAEEWRNSRKLVIPNDKSTAVRVANELVLFWLPDFLDILLGKLVGSLRIQSGVLTVTLGDRRLSNIASKAGCNIYLDATATADNIARRLGLVDLKQLLVVQQVTPTANNLEVIQVSTLGRLGLARRSDSCNQRVDATISQIQQQATGEVVVIDFKRHTKSGDGKRHWWVDSRGINDLETCQTLILTGTPCPNLGELEAEFTVLYGRAPLEGTTKVRYRVHLNKQQPADFQNYFELEASVDPEFREFVRCRILATYHQAIGRLRAHRRLGESLKVYVVADYPLDILVTHVKASEITLAAAGKKEQKLMAMLAAVEKLQATKQKVTQQAIATIVGCSQQYVSQLWNLLQKMLLDNFDNESSKTIKSSKTKKKTDISFISLLLTATFYSKLLLVVRGGLLNPVLKAITAFIQHLILLVFDVCLLPLELLEAQTGVKYQCAIR